MKYALVDGVKQEPTRGSKGVCPSCGTEVIAKCGEQKVHHWAHKGIRTCDPWWEPETGWHRTWKNNYPGEWQETTLMDEQTRERHIADVRTEHGLTIEFQHSHINPDERVSRERYYEKMVWVVDGTRLQRDYPRFREKFLGFRRTNIHGIYSVDFPDEVFPRNWLNSAVPVVFDFSGLSVTGKDEIGNHLWCLMPEKFETKTIVIGLRKEDFVKITHERDHLFVIEQKPQQRQVAQSVPTRSLPSGYGKRRGPLIDYMHRKKFSNGYGSRRRGRR